MKSPTRGGLLIPLHSEKSLKTYLDQNVYGQHIKPNYKNPGGRSSYYKVLADYGSMRGGEHVFFFRDRKIYYGGTINGSNKYGAFYINGQTSPIGHDLNTPLVWNESKLDSVNKTPDTDYNGNEIEGVFTYKNAQYPKKKAQPFLIRFNKTNLSGKYISSDELYDTLDLNLDNSMPSAEMEKTGMATITPKEVEVALNAIKNNPKGELIPKNEFNLTLDTDNMVPFDPKFVLNYLDKNEPEAYIESSILANPDLLTANQIPNDLIPSSTTTLCRQIPLISNRPQDNMDRVDIAYYEQESPRPSIPDKIIELKKRKAAKQEAEQVKKYLNWLNKIAPEHPVETYILAPGFRKKRGASSFKDHFTKKQQEKITLVSY